MTKGQRIRNKREALNIQQTDFAKKVGISKQTLYKYENDIITNIPSDKLEEIAAALHVTPSYLMGWDPILEYVDSTHLTNNIKDIDKAKELYQLYENADPEVQKAVELILRSSQPKP